MDLLSLSLFAVFILNFFSIFHPKPQSVIHFGILSRCRCVTNFVHSMGFGRRFLWWCVYADSGVSVVYRIFVSLLSV